MFFSYDSLFLRHGTTHFRHIAMSLSECVGASMFRVSQAISTPEINGRDTYHLADESRVQAR